MDGQSQGSNLSSGTVEFIDHWPVRAPGKIQNNSRYDSLRWCRLFIARSHSLRTPETNDALEVADGSS